MSNLVENPILNDAYEEPALYHHFELGKDPEVREGRRPAQYRMARASREGGVAQALHEYIELGQVNRIRERVRQWRQNGYPGVTRVTRELLGHWTSPERERRLFFCQLEAVETVIWLTEAPAAERVGIEIPKDHPQSEFSRWCCKMATGSGKTVVMAMLTAWSILNKVADRQDPRFSDAVLVVCPNLTVRDRLQVLYPEREGANGEPSYYTKFDIVPSHLRPLLTQGKVLVTNWHAFALQDQIKGGIRIRDKEEREKQIPKESDSAFCDRVLAELDGKSNILVLSDEAHHAYRFYTPSDLPSKQQEWLGQDFESEYSETEEAERARVWIEGLDRIHKIRSIRRCIDLTATPYFLKGSGRVEGEPFDWIISDFGLLDAIECGIVKVPRIPNWDNSQQGEPRYLRLYHEIKGKLPKSEKELTQEGRPVAVLQEVQGALAMLATAWKQDLRDWQETGRTVPPVMIVVCNNTAVSALLEDFIGKKGKVNPKFKNTGTELRTLRIDSKLLKDSEIKGLNQTQAEAAERLREIVRTVGKLGGKGEQVRCVVSVGMLSEGWDAQNVTQVLGLRAFSSPLLCEQVIGRGLRRFNYDDLSAPETVDVYGIPFEVLPMAKVGPTTGGGRPVTVVKSLPERSKNHEILFPRVIGYICDVKYRIRVNWDDLPIVEVTPIEDPTETGVGEPWRVKDLPAEYHTRQEFYANNRVKSALFEVAARITDNLQNRMLFPQVLKAVETYYQRKVKPHIKPGVDEREVCLERYKNLIASNLSAAIRSDDDSDEGKFKPILDPYRPLGSTNGVFFQTTLPCVKTQRSHLSHIACHAQVWERDLAVTLERHPAVSSYVRNYRLGFTIPYEFAGQTHPYTPDFIVWIRRSDGSTIHLVLEVKGLEGNQDRAKEAGARRWVDAVNNWGKLGPWAFDIVRDLTRTADIISKHSRI